MIQDNIFKYFLQSLLPVLLLVYATASGAQQTLEANEREKAALTEKNDAAQRRKEIQLASISITIIVIQGQCPGMSQMKWSARARCKSQDYLVTVLKGGKLFLDIFLRFFSCLRDFRGRNRLVLGPQPRPRVPELCLRSTPPGSYAHVRT